MLTRLLALLAVLLLAPSMPAHANARALSLESASLGFFTPNRDFLKEIPDLTHCCIKEKSTEQAESSNRREECLRARYMDPAQGRFLGMDPWSGAAFQPQSLNKYLYVSGEPVVNLDPSGNFSSAYEAIVAAGIVGIATVASAAAISVYTGWNVGNDADGLPDAAIITFGASGGSRGIGLDLGSDFIFHFASGRWFAYPSFAPGLAPLTMFNGFRNRLGPSWSAGLIFNMNHPDDWAGLGVGMSEPYKAGHLLLRMFDSPGMGYAVRQLSRYAHRPTSQHWTLQLAASTSGPGAIRLGYRSNSFTANIGWGFGPFDVSMKINDILDGSIIEDVKRMRFDFGYADSLVGRQP